MASIPKKPTIVLVPGMCCVGPLVYAPLIKQLTSQGWAKSNIITMSNPSVDAAKTHTPLIPNGLDADIASLRQVLSNLIETAGSDVLLVGHSYGGTPSLSAADGLWKHQRTSQGLDGGVVRVALIGAALTLPGASIAATRTTWQMANDIPLDAGAMFEVDGEHFLDPTGFDAFWFNDIDQSERANYALRPSAMSTVLSPVKESVDPRSWRITYLVLTELDFAMPEGFQRELIQRATEAGAEVAVEVLRSGHFAQISHSEEVAAWLAGLV